jgi:hypothetical protein
MHNIMSEYEQKSIESNLRSFTNRHFEQPDNCRNLEQTQYYVKELCTKINEYKVKFNYVPDWAYALLSQYNQVHNSLLYKDFHRQHA